MTAAVLKVKLAHHSVTKEGLEVDTLTSYSRLDDLCIFFPPPSLYALPLVNLFLASFVEL